MTEYEPTSEGRDLEKEVEQLQTEQQRREEFRVKWRAECEVRLNEQFGYLTITLALRDQIWRYFDTDVRHRVAITGANLGATTDTRSEWGSSGCVAYFTQVKIFYGDQMEMREWQVRNRRGEDTGHYIRRIDALYEEPRDEAIIVHAKLINYDSERKQEYYHWETFRFAPMTADGLSKTKPEVYSLSATEQEAFLRAVIQATDQTLQHKLALWPLKPTMPADMPGMGMQRPHYDRPRIDQTKIEPKLGLAAWVVEEQIDHDVRDRQLRRELYVLRHGQSAADYMAEDHGYNSQGGAMLSITKLTPTEITFTTTSGQRTMRFEDGQGAR